MFSILLVNNSHAGNAIINSGEYHPVDFIEQPDELLPLEWLDCSKDTDCVDVAAGCNEGAYNKNFEREVRKEYMVEAINRSCAPIIHDRLRAVCSSEKICRLLPANN